MSYLKRYYEKCHGCAVGDLPHPDGLLEEADAEIVKLRKELEEARRQQNDATNIFVGQIESLEKQLDEANEAVIAAHMLAFEKGKDAAKAELAEAREGIAIRERQLQNALGIAACGKNGTGYYQLILRDGRVLDVIETPVSASEFKPDRPVLVPLDEARAFLAAKETKG